MRQMCKWCHSRSNSESAMWILPRNLWCTSKKNSPSSLIFEGYLTSYGGESPLVPVYFWGLGHILFISAGHRKWSLVLQCTSQQNLEMRQKVMGNNVYCSLIGCFAVLGSSGASRRRRCIEGGWPIKRWQCGSKWHQDYQETWVSAPMDHFSQRILSEDCDCGRVF